MPPQVCYYTPKTLTLGSRQQAIEFWHNVIGDYTGAELTQATDKLVAISSLAAMVQKALGSEYCAGLWTLDLLHQLLWRTADTTNPSGSWTRYTEYVAPSWSWASINGPIRFNEHLSFDEGPRFSDDLVSDIAISATPVFDETPLGQLKAGHLTLHGRLIDVTSMASELEWQQQGAVRVAIYRRGFEAVTGSDFMICPDEIVASFGDVDLSQRKEAANAATKYYLLPLRRYDQGSTEFRGLVLKDAQSMDGSRVFCRWGEFRIDGDEGWETLQSGCREFDKDFREGSGLDSVYDNELGGYKYIVTII
jgi:hypothetical protein